MEVALKVNPKKLLKRAYKVSILILMEVALKAYSDSLYKIEGLVVSILILMEVALKEIIQNDSFINYITFQS